MAVLPRTPVELPDPRGNVMDDVHAAVLVREHGMSLVCARDVRLHHVPFLTVTEPLLEPGA